MPDGNLNFFAPLLKVDIQKRLVYGCLACEEPDDSGEIMDYASAKPEFQKWNDEMAKASDGKSIGNIREMHGKSAAAKLISIEFNDALKKVYGWVKVVDDAAWNKVMEGVYTGFSIGGGYLKKWKDAANAKLTRYTPSIMECSLVDVPCIKSATFEVIKADGSTEMRKFKEAAPEYTGPIQGFQAKDGTFFTKKVAAEKHDEALAKAAAAAEVQHPALDALKKVEEQVEALEEGKPAPKVETPKPMLKAGDDLTKGFEDLARLVALRGELSWLMEKSTGIDLKALTEAIDGIVTADIAQIGNSAEHDIKAVKLSRATADRLAKVAPPLLEKIKIQEPAAPEAPASDALEKLNQSLTLATDELSKLRAESAGKDKIISGLGDGLEKLTKRLEHLERQPMPPRGVLRAVDRDKERVIPTENAQPKKEAGDTLKMPQGLSPGDQRLWMAANQPKKH